MSNIPRPTTSDPALQRFYDAVVADLKDMRQTITSVTRTINYTMNDQTSVMKDIAPDNSVINEETLPDAVTVVLTASDQSVTYNKNGKTPNPTTVRITATVQGVKDTTGIDYHWFVDGVHKASTSDNYYDIANPALYTEKIAQVKVGVNNQPKDTNDFSATDSIAIYGIKAGKDAVTVILSNDNHTVPVSATSVADYTGSGTNVSVFHGTTELTYVSGTPTAKSTFSITPTATGITCGAITKSGTGKGAVIANHSGLVGTKGSISLKVYGHDTDSDTTAADMFSVDKVISIASAKTGANGVSGVNGTNGTNGGKGDDAPVSITGLLYYTSLTSTPSSVSGGSVAFDSTGKATVSPPTYWSTTPPAMGTGGGTMRYVSYSASGYKGTSGNSISYGAISTGFAFSELVTFTKQADGTKKLDSTTVIDGGQIKTGTISGNSGNYKFSINFETGKAAFNNVTLSGGFWDSDTTPRFRVSDAGLASFTELNVGCEPKDILSGGYASSIFDVRRGSNDPNNTDYHTASAKLWGYFEATGNITSVNGFGWFGDKLNVGGSNYTTTQGAIGCKYWTSGSVALRPTSTTGTYSLGTSGNRWGTIFSDTATINTSDASKKTPISFASERETRAATALTKEIGTYRFLEAIKRKGDDARVHIGLTVQRAIEIMRNHDLDPFSYAFICYDAAGVDPDTGLRFDESYGFRYSELLAFLAIGFDARLTALEEKMSA
jgi:hypothetical protein